MVLVSKDGRIVDLCGAVIEVDSKIGMGSEFMVVWEQSQLGKGFLTANH